MQFFEIAAKLRLAFSRSFSTAKNNQSCGIQIIIKYVIIYNQPFSYSYSTRTKSAHTNRNPQDRFVVST